MWNPSGGPVREDLVRKLSIRPGHRVFVRDECSGILDAIRADLPPNVTVTSTIPGKEKVNVVLLRPQPEELSTLFEEAKTWIVPNGAVWVVVKRKAYREEGDVSFDDAQAAALPTGLVYNKECTVSGTEYATRYVLRNALRPKA